MKYLVAFVLCLSASASFACDNYYYQSSNYCNSGYYAQPRIYKSVPTTPKTQEVPQIENQVPKTPDVVPERIETPTTKTFKTKMNENLVLQVPSTMEVQSVVYVKVMVSSGEMLTIPLVNNTFPVIKGNVCTYSPNGVQYNQNHYNTLVQRGYLQFGKKSTFNQFASN
jgi:hypothetical protein